MDNQVEISRVQKDFLNVCAEYLKAAQPDDISNLAAFQLYKEIWYFLEDNTDKNIGAET